MKLYAAILVCFRCVKDLKAYFCRFAKNTPYTRITLYKIDLADPLSPNNTLGQLCYKAIYAFFYISFRRKLRNTVSLGHKNKPPFPSFINPLRHLDDRKKTSSKITEYEISLNHADCFLINKRGTNNSKYLGKRIKLNTFLWFSNN